MHSFKDTKGREWSIPVFNLANLRSVQQETGIFLPHLLSAGANDSKAELERDALKFLDVLVVLLGDAYKNAGITVEQFTEGLDGDVIASAESAIMQALIAFFPKSKRGLLTSATAKAKELDQTVTELMTRMVSDSGETSTAQSEGSAVAATGLS